ncbi:hypothetical protein HPB50_014944 [Hyalomma asiaticum]|uniref:Uncharacterized protein n=1 Tax=Hyalomma asiaticum TaxID=266040 RepID=A0ACB7S3N9_HYAAI|nr:hypothetical protein HPB50_014944 [Hyalomma asiaticum]
MGGRSLRRSVDGDLMCGDAVRTLVQSVRSLLVTIGPGGDLPEAVSRGGGALAIDPDAVSCFLERGRSLEVPVQVEVPGAKLHWRLQAKDVGFALWRVSGDNRVQVLAPRRIACDRDPECGQMHCDQPGTYTFTFDNSFSWFNGKQLSYVIRVHHESVARPDESTRKVALLPAASTMARDAAQEKRALEQVSLSQSSSKNSGPGGSDAWLRKLARANERGNVVANRKKSARTVLLQALLSRFEDVSLESY